MKKLLLLALLFILSVFLIPNNDAPELSEKDKYRNFVNNHEFSLRERLTPEQIKKAYRKMALKYHLIVLPPTPQEEDPKVVLERLIRRDHPEWLDEDALTNGNDPDMNAANDGEDHDE